MTKIKFTCKIFMVLVLTQMPVFGQNMFVKQYNLTGFSEEQKEVTRELSKLTPQASFAHPEFGILPYNSPCSDCKELIHKRTLHSRHFFKDGSNGKHFFVQQALFPLHRQDASGNLISLDHRLKSVGAGLYQATNQVFPTGLNLQEGYVFLKADELEFRHNQNLSAWVEGQGQVTQHFGQASKAQFSLGEEGWRIFGAWPGIDVEIIFQRDLVKTNFLVTAPLALPLGADFLVIEDEIELPENFRLNYDPQGGAISQNGLWQGSLSVNNEEGLPYVSISEIKCYDYLVTRSHKGFYEIEQIDPNRYKIKYKVSADWLNLPGHTYPITIDPIVTGFDSIGRFVIAASSIPGVPPTDFMGKLAFTTVSLGSCDYILRVTVPGMSRIIGTYIDLEYWMPNSPNCDAAGSMPACVFSNVTMEIVDSVCGNSTGQLMCIELPGNPPIGRCTTDPNLVPGAGPIPFPNLLSCIPPQCPDYELSFTLKNRENRCIPVTCGLECAIGNYFAITIEARTIENVASITASGSGIISVSGDTVTICPGDTAELTPYPDWGVPPYNFVWQPGGLTDPVIYVSPAQNTIYIVQAYDTCGNPDPVPDSIWVILRSLPFANAGPDLVLCQGDVGRIGSQTVSGINYVWSADTALAMTFLNGPFFASPTVTVPMNFLGTVTYYLDVNDGFCSNKDTVMVTVTPSPSVTITGGDTLCAGGSATIEAPPGFAGYLWNTGETTQQIEVLGSGSYFVTVTDINGCTGVSNTVSVGVLPVPVMQSGPDTVVVVGSLVQLFLLGNIDDFDSIAWSGTLPLSCTDCPNPVVQAVSDGEFMVTVWENGCSTSGAARVRIQEGFSDFIPTAFSPNNDGMNDILRVLLSKKVRLLEFRIYNRWGELVHDDPNRGWDGTFKDVPQPIGTYIYHYVIETGEGARLSRSGNVTLIR